MVYETLTFVLLYRILRLTHRRMRPARIGEAVMVLCILNLFPKSRL